MNIGPVGSSPLPPSSALYRDEPATTSAVPSGGPDATPTRAPASTAAKAAPVGGDWSLAAPDNLMAQALWSCRAQVLVGGKVVAESTATSPLKSVAADLARQEALKQAGALRAELVVI